MTADDPLRTQRATDSAITDELRAAGFDDAREIGRGGFGVVYRCTQSALDRAVAVKVLTGDLDDEDRARFLREQRAMGRLTGHPNVVSVLEVGVTESGLPFLVMPYHPQDSIDVRIRRHGPLTMAETLRLGVKMAGALETAHRFGIVHRDVKPGNILLTDYGEPALTDFGIAHITGGFQTATGTITGSPAFTAPEVLGGDPPSPSSDVYGLGATLFSALTGHAAFERRSGEQVVAQFLRITTQPTPDLSEAGIDADVAAVVERAMSRDPRERPSAATLGEVLQEIQFNRGIPIDEMSLRSEPDAERDRRRPTRPSTGRSPTDQPPPPSTSGTDGDLPLDLTSFVGRRKELSEAKRLLSASRLVTLTGIGGVGKTRLALRVAANTQRAFADGVRLVELGDLHDGSLLGEVVATELGLRHRNPKPLHTLVEFLRTREMLLVLDNCEQVVDAAADLTQTLLRTCPGLRVLATSRETLDVAGESALRVRPLTVPDSDKEPSPKGLPSYDAVTLFAERAATTVPGFEVTEDNADAVARICIRLDGLPLAIELAAARLRTMSPEQILQRLTNRYELLTRGSRSAPTRQQTLRWSIDWSYDLCLPAEQQLWAQLSVFAGSFELEAAEWVYADDAEPGGLLDLLASLVDKSILIREEARAVVRFRMLETLRDYGRDKLEQAGTLSEIRRRHRSWYRQLALDAESGWISHRQVVWLARLDREQPNLREAMEFSLSQADESSADAGLEIATALFPFWLSCGRLREGRRWLDRALAFQDEHDTALRVKALYSAGVLATRHEDLERAAALIDRGRALAESRGSALDRALMHHATAAHALHSGNPDRAVRSYTEALTVLRGGNNLLAHITALHGIGLAHEVLGHTEDATACLEEAIRIAESHGESVTCGRSSLTLGLVMWRKGDRDRAVMLLRKGLELARLVDDPLGATWCIEILAWISSSEKDFHRAAVLMAAAEVLRRRVGTSTLQIPNLTGSHEECELITRRALGQRPFTAASHEGEALSFDAAVSYALGEPAPVAPPRVDPATALTTRERQVADLVARGLTNKAIAARLVISQRTAQGHVEHILAKLGFSSRTQIAAWVTEQAGARG
ncbi:protein kinase domain-containing protein [Rhodococcus wratislaviensis]|uniref:Putative serine/threonine protein kinase n=1 Tax=Rhodococcus wratislaviensis NBRC 100605 TaxID=1219028 RepID=X0QCV0_RHOWR|nr:protein kinase [Rhodococcus wratislaviensis]GAF49422.1 putative serine/threonine protein kinase [Rhodococcus wratislaviensis NBRC 100605]